MATLKDLKRRYSRIEKRASIEGGWFDAYKALRTLALNTDLPRENAQELFESGLKGLINLAVNCEDEDLAAVKDLSTDIALYWEHLPEKREDLLWF